MSIRRRVLATAAAAAFLVPGFASAQEMATRLVTTGLVRPTFVTHAPGDDQ
jgi:hypothetical protein